MHAISDLRNGMIPARDSEHLAGHAEQGKDKAVPGFSRKSNVTATRQSSKHTLAYHLEAAAKIIDKQQRTIDHKQIDVQAAKTKSRRIKSQVAAGGKKANIKLQPPPPQIQVCLRAQQQVFHRFHIGIGKYNKQ